MANGMGSLYVGSAGLRNSQNALNTTANNLANVDTKGYVRQQVLFADAGYTTIDKNSAYSYQQVGLGVTIGDVVHSRDIFLDQYYRNTSGRQAFYSASYDTVTGVEDLFQELEGATYQETLKDFWVSFQELAKQPDSAVNQGLVIQKATLFLERAQSIYANMESYQQNMNVQITDTVDRINTLGNSILELNKQIMSIESGGVETAMSLRDERDNALDELSSLVDIQIKENSDGVVKVSIEGVGFVDEVRVNEIGLHLDKLTDLKTPYWPHLSNEDKDKIYEVFSFANGIVVNRNDVGKLKALVLSRGDHVANYTDISEATLEEYNNEVAASVMLNAQAQLDQLIHGIVTEINDLLCPNKVVTFVDENAIEHKDVKVWDDQGSVGSDGVKPGHELFVRRGTDRYTEVKGQDGTIYYVYNEEDPNNRETQYTLSNLLINDVLIQEESHLPYIKPDGSTDWDLAAKLADIWSQDRLKLTPDDPDSCTFVEYYQRMLDGVASQGSVYKSLSESLSGSVTSIDNQRQQVVGVSADEELTNMIKYQNAYNAASRYINVVSEMIEHIIMQLGV